MRAGRLSRLISPSPGLLTRTLSGHYEQPSFAERYEAAFFYSSRAYVEHILQHIREILALPDEEARIVDIGGGTGNFTNQLAQIACTRHKVLCVDNFEEMLRKAQQFETLECKLIDALGFASLPPEEIRYSHILLKEVIHHIASTDYSALFGGIHRQLLPHGLVLIITRPQEVDYPLFTRARKIWREHQPPVEDIVLALQVRRSLT